MRWERPGSAEMPHPFFDDQLDRAATWKGEMQKTEDVLLPARVLILRQSFCGNLEFLDSFRNRCVGKLLHMLLQSQFQGGLKDHQQHELFQNIWRVICDSNALCYFPDD